MRPPQLNNVRLQCRQVAEQTDFVQIDAAALHRYAASLPPNELDLPQMDPAIHYLGHNWETVAYFITLDAVNFGSGYFPDIFGDPQKSGYRSMAAALTDYFASHGPIPPAELRRLSAADCARIFCQDSTNPAAFELMGLFARSLNELGAFLCDRFDGNFAGVVESADRSAQRLVKILTAMPLFNDVALYRGMTVPFLKRAQLTAADLFIAFAGDGPGRFDDIDRLTICTDNLVPHVLRLDGILLYREELTTRIELGQPLQAGSAEEVEIRACAIHAAELIVAELHRNGLPVNAMMLDNFLWHRGHEQLYREQPRHRTRTVFY